MNYVSSILAKFEVARSAEAADCLARHTTTPGTPGDGSKTLTQSLTD